MNDKIIALEAVLEETNDIQKRIDTLNDLAWVLYRDDTDRSIQLSEQAIQLSHNKEHFNPPYYTGTITGAANQAIASLYRSKPKETLNQALETIELANKHNIKTLLPRLLYAASVAYGRLGDLANSLKYILQQQTISQELHDKEGLARGSLLLGMLYAEQSDYERALEVLYTSIEMFRELGDGYSIILQLTNASEVYDELNDYDNALKSALDGLDVYQHYSLTQPRIKVIALNKVGIAYTKLKQYQKAQHYLNKSVALAEKLGQADIHTQGLLSLANLLNKLEHPEKAILYAKRSIEISNEHNLSLIHANGYRVLSDAYRLLHDYKKALAHYTQFHTLEESVFNDKNREKIHSLQVLHNEQIARQETEHYVALYETEQSHRHLAESMSHVGKILSSTLELNTVLNHILIQLKTIISFDRGNLLLLHDSTLDCVTTYGYPDNHTPLLCTKPFDIHNEKDIFVQIWKSKRPLTLTNLHDNPNWAKELNLPTAEVWMGVPLIHHNKLIGIVSLTRTTDKPFTKDEITAGITFAAQAAASLENAQLYAQISSMNEHLENEVHIRTKNLHIANDELQQLNRAKTDFIAITAHELQTPITLLMGYGELLQIDSSIAESTRQSHLVERILNGANRMHEVINRMLLMVKIDSNELAISPEPFIIQTLFNKLIRALTPTLEERNLIVELANNLIMLPPIEGDIDMLETVFNNLLINAIKYTPDRGKIRIDCHLWTSPPAPDYPKKGIEITIYDSGIGIAPNNLNLIFSKMYPTNTANSHSSGKTKFKGGGPGLGLSIARGIIEAHNGRIWAESDGYDEEKLHGSSFHIVLPLTQPET